jgi:hypothetical protein
VFSTAIKFCVTGLSEFGVCSLHILTSLDFIFRSLSLHVVLILSIGGIPTHQSCILLSPPGRMPELNVAISDHYVLLHHVLYRPHAKLTFLLCKILSSHKVCKLISHASELLVCRRHKDSSLLRCYAMCLGKHGITSQKT